MERPPDARALLRLAERVGTADLWNQQAAAAWWLRHLPKLTSHEPVVLPEWETDPGASPVTVLAGLGGAPWMGAESTSR
jgi:hypothetical protein